MAVPTTVDDLLGLVAKSQLIDQKRLASFLDRRRADGSLPAEPDKLARSLVKEGLLTRFQAEQLLAGKWRGFEIGNYKVLDRLGSGGMSTVYLCQHKVMRHQVAVKVLSNRKADDPVVVKRFEREGRAAAALDHPNVIRARDIGFDGTLHYLVMDYVPGSSLQEVVQAHGPLSVGRACHYIWQAAQGLHHAHQNNLIHRDVKPANLLLDHTGTVKVLDLGMARFFEGEEERLTEHLIGTADYLAPEQARDSHNVDLRADIYALGGAFYFLLTGQPPFNEAKSVGQKLIMLQIREPKPVRELRADVPPEVEAIVMRMLRKDLEQRYQSLEEVIRDLTPWVPARMPVPSEAELPRSGASAKNLRSTEIELNLGAAGGSGGSMDRRSSAVRLAPMVRPPTAKRPLPWRLIAVVAAVAALGLGAVLWLLFLGASSIK